MDVRVTVILVVDLWPVPHTSSDMPGAAKDEWMRSLSVHNWAMFENAIDFDN